ncbi:MAG: threonine-phosphate decarboxylase CobD [Geminocystis sp.]|nr:threonine-phosphate decarboxylase CobD [Geminocystis sp.]HIK37525.1 threonine-phosphate decarboxylase [Geminocystis sp. M7585_C2015_104]MCS7146679.1 threonine-phosphate decarboxylase CobD [Geminocystis sp.]MCX8077171.1 threonine-phosphate decarboxylase CobD [Geminocystis sp.]MDW8115505.1 threonine-phosphate decarboxylase CobD [Geminocystis sp.]
MVNFPRPVHGGNIDWAVSLINCPAEEVLDFSASINPLGPPEGVIATLARAIRDVRHYPSPNYPMVRETIAQYHQLEREWILPGNGVAELLTWAAWECHQLEGVLLPSPGFADYLRALQAFGVNYSFYPLDYLGGDLSHLAVNPSRWAIWINNPHNPTGRLWQKESLKRYLEEFALVLVDEAFMDFLPPPAESLLDLIGAYDNLVIFRSLTKFYSLPGLRIGYAISHPERLRRWQKWRDPWPVNVLAAVAAKAAMEDEEFRQKTWQWLPPTRTRLQESLAAIEGLTVYPSHANFLLVGSVLPTTRLQWELLKGYKLLIRDCLSFPELGDGYFRVAVRLQKENQLLSRAIASVFASVREKN